MCGTVLTSTATQLLFALSHSETACRISSVISDWDSRAIAPS